MNILEFANQTLLNPRLAVEKKSPTFWPSEGGLTMSLDGRTWREGGCNRKLYYRYMGYPTEQRGNTLDNALILNNGHTVQAYLENVLKIGRVWLGSEVPIQVTRTIQDVGRYVISGAIDIIVQDPDTGRPIFVECKTTGSYGARDGLVQAKAGRLAPKIDHVLQVMPYLDWARNEGGIQDPEFHVIYIERDHMKGAEHIVRLGPDDRAMVENEVGLQVWDDVTLGRLYADFDQTAVAVKEKQIPDRPFQLKYDRATVLWLYEHGKLFAAEMKAVASALKKGIDGPIIDKGDFACKVCPFKYQCWGTAIPSAEPAAFAKIDSSETSGDTPGVIAEAPV